jgi:hypothetical protein
MEHFIDDLSKQLAKTVSRRDMLSITSRTLFTAFLASTSVAKLWGRMSPESSDDIGTTTCGGVQKTIQLAFRDPSAFQHHTAYVRAVAQSVAAAGDLITEDCSECIVEQFAKSVPISQQQPCGPVVMPTQFCWQTGATAEQIRTATVLAMHAAPDAWSDDQQFDLLLVLAEEILGCLFDVTAPQPSATQVATASVMASAVSTAPPPPVIGPHCETPGVKYCGPTNSLEHPGLPAVAPCLNEACFSHDNCYSEHCISGPCFFTPQTARICDDSLLVACQICSFGSASDPLFGNSIFVCQTITCLMGGPVCDPNAQPNLQSKIACISQNRYCEDQLTIRGNIAQCNQTAAQCSSCDGRSPCGSIAGQGCCVSQFCCPCGQTCANGRCQCGPGQIGCDLHCCPSGGTCCPGPTVDVLPFCCAAGQTCCGATCCDPGVVCCGTTCCAPGQTCKNGTCTSCPAGQIACGSTCCASGLSCSNGQCVCPTGQPMCGTICCPAGETCQNGTCTGCPTGQIACGSTCCASNQTCCFQESNGLFGCIPSTAVCCPTNRGYTETCNGSFGEFCCPPGCCFAEFAGAGATCCSTYIGITPQGQCCGAGWSCCPGVNGGCCPPGTSCVFSPTLARNLCCPGLGC